MRSFVNPYFSHTEKINFLTSLLNIKESYLASYVGLTHKGLLDINNSKKLNFENLFLFLYNVKFTNKDPKNIRSFLYNERIIFDPSDEEDGDICVLNFITSKDELIKDIPEEIKEIIELYNQGESNE